MTALPHSHPGNGTHLDLATMIQLRATARALFPRLRQPPLANGASPHSSVFRGRGMEFDEVRGYQPGDDARHIDWRVTARRGDLYTKIFREERERPLMLLADLHPGLFFGSQRVFKSVLSLELMALIAWTAEAAGDRVGGIIANPEQHHQLPPQRRETGVLQLLQRLENLQPDAPGEATPGHMDTLLGELLRLARPGSQIVIVSDFMQAGEHTETLLSALRQHHDVRVAFIADPLESSPPIGRIQIGTPLRRLAFDTRLAQVRRRWAQPFRQRWRRIETLCHKQCIRLIRFDTCDEPSRLLGELL